MEFARGITTVSGRRHRQAVALSLSAVLAVSLMAGSSQAAVAKVATGVSAGVLAAASSSVGLPRTAKAVATIDGWTLAGPSEIGEVAPEVGSVKSGSVALGIDAPVIAKTTTAASTEVEVQPGTTYSFSAYVRVQSKTTKSVAMRFALDRTPIRVPKLNARWKQVTGTVTTGPKQTAMDVGIRVSRAVRGLSIDAVRLVARSGPTKGVNVIPNPSFESVVAKRGIVSSSLVMTTPAAAVAVAMPVGKPVRWSVTRSGKKVKSGVIKRAAALSSIPLVGVKQGLYTLRVRGGDGKLTKTTIAIVDSPTPWIAKDPRAGVGLHVEDDLYDDAARYTRALGISHARSDVRWNRVEKAKGVYDWSLYDEDFQRLNAQGVGVLAIAGYGNPAYGKANAGAPRNATGYRAYGNYAAAMAKRYDLAGIEVYNEFNWTHNESNCRSAACYVPLAKRVDKMLATVDPKLPVVVGGTAKYPASWFKSLWQRGALKFANAVSFHPYEKTGKPEEIRTLVRQSRASMKKYGKSTRPVWITELGTSAAIGNRTTTEQASILMRSTVSAYAGGASRFYWYNLINDGTDRREHFDNFGLYEHPTSGVAAVAPKPAAFAQALMTTQLGGRKYRAAERVGAGVVSHAFGTAKNSVRVVWAPKGKKTATIRTSRPVVVVNFDGTTRTVKPKRGVVKISVTKNPVFVRSGAATAGVTR